MDSKEVKETKKHVPHFPTAKIKKIIQENQQIGKLSNLIPPLMEKSLQTFLQELLMKSQEVGNRYNLGKLTPSALKKALQQLDHYDFMKDLLDDVQDISQIGTKRKSSKRQDKLTSKKSKEQPQGQEKVQENEDKAQKEKKKSGRKKVKTDVQKNEQQQ